MVDQRTHSERRAEPVDALEVQMRPLANRRSAPPPPYLGCQETRTGHTARGRLGHEARGISVLLRSGPEMRSRGPGQGNHLLLGDDVAQWLRL